MIQETPIHKKKILIRIGSLRHGGAEKVLVTFLKNLSSEKYEIDLLLNLYSGKYLAEVPNWVKVKYLNKGEMITTNRIQDIPIKAYRKGFQWLLKKFPNLLYSFILQNKKYDIEFAAIHGMSEEILNSPNKNSKKIIWVHNDLSEVKTYNTEKLKKFFKFDGVLVISDKMQNYFSSLAETPIESAKIKRIYNPIDMDEILMEANETITNKGLKEFMEQKNAGPLFVSVGTVFPQKGFDRLLQSHKKLKEEGFIHRILIVGDGYDYNAINRLRNELDIEDTALMAGFQQNPYPYLKAADYFILPSRYEGFPTVLYEAITLKKKIIATEVSGVSEMLQEGKLGLIVQNSEEGIYNGMKTAITEPGTFMPYQKNMATFNFPFSLNNSVKEIENIWNEL